MNATPNVTIWIHRFVVDTYYAQFGSGESFTRGTQQVLVADGDPALARVKIGKQK
jgi:hypothetical protein